MPPQVWFFVSIAFSFIAWGIVTARYIWPGLRLRQRAEALRPLLILHSFRFIGLAFLVPGVVSPDLPSAFAHSAAYGDIIAAILALLALISLPSASGVVIAWIFSLWGTADLFNAFYQANHAGLLAGQLGAAFFLPTLVVPLLLITHGLAFRILLQHQPEPAMQESRHLAKSPSAVARSAVGPHRPFDGCRIGLAANSRSSGGRCGGLILVRELDERLGFGELIFKGFPARAVRIDENACHCS